MANTNKGRKAYICVTAKPTDLTQGQYEALTWVEIGNVGAIGESGIQTNLPTYDELDTEVTQKQKGISNAGSPTIECARNPTDVGQVAIRAAAATKFNYAFKFEDEDAPSVDFTNTTYYNRGVVTGPTRPNGRNEDFILEVFTLGLNQTEIVVNPVALVAPVNSVTPAISGASVQVGVTLTAYDGEWTNEPTSFTYQWQHDVSGNLAFSNVATGGTAKTYVPVAADILDSLRVQVTAVNGEGTPVTANSPATTPIIAA